MIPCSPARLESEPWQRELADAITDPTLLLQSLEIDPDALPRAFRTGDDFPLRVPRYFAGLMRRGDPLDPLLAQVLPVVDEQYAPAGYVRDPVGDLDASLDCGILKKYRGRALMITTGACAIHCRYCFRRHFPYAEQSVLRHWEHALAALHGMPDTTELILSGGDPLTLSDKRLAQLVAEAEKVPHLRRLRIHSRVPVVLPSRVTGGLQRILAGSRLQGILVIHANHPNEITDELAHALRLLSDIGVTLLNQSVLLKSVNDDADTLANLSESLFRIGVMPYYLHLLDPVLGATHFEVPTGKAETLLERLRIDLPGYLVPRLVREQRGVPYKTPLGAL